MDHLTAKPALSARDVISARMKAYEEIYDVILPADNPFILRFDGRTFTTFTHRHLKQPFDGRFVVAMRQTTEDLVNQFQPSAAYVQSDEISLIFPVKPIDPTAGEPPAHTFSARVEKLVSVTAGIASVRFNKHMERLIGVDDFGTPHFDCRAFSVPDEDEVLAAIHWRCAFDWIRNSKSRFAAEFLGYPALNGMSSQEAVELVESKFGKRWEDLEEHVKYGWLVKKGVEKEGVDLRTGEVAITTRKEVVSRTVLDCVRKGVSEGREWLMGKFWP
jgi:tRNA(His) guanylyltransferase